MVKRNFNALVKILFLCLALYILVFIFVYKPLDKKYSSFDTLPVLDVQRVSSGYTLISPYNRLLTDDPGFKGTVYLLDMLGKPVHTWNTDHQVLYSFFTKDGNLLTIMEQPKYSQFFPPGGNTGMLQKRDWDSKVLWEYKNEAMHHDVDELPNGNLVVALWEKTPAEISSQVEGGVGGTEMEGGLIWSDEIAEIDPKGKKVWSWHSYEHLDPSVDLIGHLVPRYSWTHTNGLEYMEENPIDGKPGYLISMRSTSTVYIVRKEDGRIIWRSPKGMLSLQHDPTLLANGNILIFDNGFERVPAPFSSYGSRAVEINPKTNKVVWEWSAGQGPIDKIKFYTPIVGGAQRLENGNTLITDGTRGHIFEVTKEGKVVWDLVNPYTTKMTGAFPNNFLFKSRRYVQDEIKSPEVLPIALDNFKLGIHSLLNKIYPQ